MKTFTQFLNEALDPELKKYGIKELQDDLTLETIKEKFPWILKAKIKNAVLGDSGCETEFKIGWFGGTWLDGTWEDGFWDGGTWEKGTWKKGWWWNGVWKNGTWKSGRWEKGVWKNGTWISGWWLGGKWQSGSWEDDTHPHPNERGKKK
jgi:hypothetical protein